MYFNRQEFSKLLHQKAEFPTLKQNFPHINNPENWKTQIVTKLKNTNCDKTKKKSCDTTPNSQTVTNLKLWQNSKNKIVTKLKNSNSQMSM